MFNFSLFQRFNPSVNHGKKTVDAERDTEKVDLCCCDLRENRCKRKSDTTEILRKRVFLDAHAASAMAHNSQFDFRLKVDILELDLESKSTATTPDGPSASVASITALKIASPVATVTDYAIRTLDTFQIEPNDIEYRAEGNANIVLALPQRCQVLRLPKHQRLQRLYSLYSSSFFFLSFFWTNQVTKSKLNKRTAHTRTHIETY